MNKINFFFFNGGVNLNIFIHRKIKNIKIYKKNNKNKKKFNKDF